jgi:hypothetical protein
MFQTTNQMIGLRVDLSVFDIQSFQVLFGVVLTSQQQLLIRFYHVIRWPAAFSTASH